MKRAYISGFVALMLLLVCLTACGSAPAATTPAAPPTAVTTPVATDPTFVNPVADHFTITLNQGEGYAIARWEPVGEATYYLCKIYTVEDDARVDVTEYTLIADWVGTPVTCTDVPVGYGVEVIPQDANRQALATDTRLISNIYGTLAERESYAYPTGDGRVSYEYDIKWSDLTSFDLLDSIVEGSLVTNEDGTLTFNVLLPDGRAVRFYGKNVEFKDGNLVIYADGGIWGLDAFGRILACDLRTTGDLPGEYSLLMRSLYTFDDDKRSVNHPSELCEGVFLTNNYIWGAIDRIRFVGCETQSNFFGVGAFLSSGGDAPVATLSEIVVYYDTKTYTTALGSIEFNFDFVQGYLEGDRYDPTRESFDSVKGIFDFYMFYYVEPLDYIEKPYVPSAVIESDAFYTVGELKDKDGTVMNKRTDGLSAGATIDVTVGDYTVPVALRVLPRFDGADTQHELVPYAYPEALGEINVLVVPIVWQNTPEVESEETLRELYHALGRVLGRDGTAKDYSDGVSANGYSLSEYYGAASYGQLNLTSFVTDWCYLPYHQEDNSFALSHDRAMEIIHSVYSMHPEMDFSAFDQDENGYFDAVIFVNVMSIGTMTQNFYTPVAAGTAEKLGINGYSNVSLGGLAESSVLLHEFGHTLGLIDYYDVTYRGIDAVGQFDMQSQSLGDWNPYSKYSVGWITPEVVTGLDSGESVEFTIGAFADTGDAIVIPGAESAYNGTPFGEYLMIDLFTDGGLNEKDASLFGLENTVGVRIYHVNSVMEGRVLDRDGREIQEESITEETYPIGTVNKVNSYSANGSYHLELIQSGGDNTFTDLENLRTALTAEDLFHTGDVFDVSEYTEFFAEGRLDDGKEFGYIIEILSVTEGDAPTATIRITRK